MVPSIDQTLSLKTAIKDEISPALQKISQGLKTTQQAIDEFEKAVKKISGGVASSTDQMHKGTKRSTDAMQKDIKETNKAFESLGSTAKSSSQEVAQALKDALYTRDASEAFDHLEKDLSGLKDTFHGMASTTRPASIKAGKVKAMGTDTLNKRVIPAFQELHATLDDFPDTLEDINRLQEEQLNSYKKSGGMLKGVSERVGGLGDSIKKFKFDLEDFAGAVAGTMAYRSADKLQTAQVETAQIAGLDDMAALPDLWVKALQQSQAPMEVWKDGLLTMQELTSASAEEMPGLVADFTNISKVTGLATGEIAQMHDTLTNIAGLRGDEFTSVLQSMNQMAKEGRASMAELGTALSAAADNMGLLTQEGRKAYAEAMLAGQSSIKEMGLEGVESIEQFADRLMTDKTAYQSAALMANQAGMSREEFDASFKKGEFDKLFNSFAAGLDVTARQASEGYARGEMMSPFELEAIQGVSQTGVSPQFLAKIREEREKTGAGMTAREWAETRTAEMRAKTQGADQAFADQVGAIRGTIPEQRERARAVAETGEVVLGRSAAPVIQKGQEKLLNLAQTGMDKFIKWDDKYDRMFSSAMAYYGLASPMKTLLKNVTQFIPFGGEKISNAMDSGLGGALTTGGLILALKTFLGGESDNGVGVPTANIPAANAPAATLQTANIPAATLQTANVAAARLPTPFEVEASRQEEFDASFKKGEFDKLFNSFAAGLTATVAATQRATPFEREASRQVQKEPARVLAPTKASAPSVDQMAQSLQGHKERRTPYEMLTALPLISHTKNALEKEAAKTSYKPGEALRSVGPQTQTTASVSQSLTKAMQPVQQEQGAAARVSYPGQIPQRQESQGMPTQIEKPAAPSNDLSIITAIGHRIDQEKETGKAALKAAIDTIIPFRQESALILKTFVESKKDQLKFQATAVKTFLDVKKEKIKDEIGVVKNFVSATMRSQKAVLVELIGGTGEVQRQTNQNIVDYLKQTVKQTTQTQGSSALEMNNSLMEAQLAQGDQLVGINKEMKESMDAVLREGERQSRTASLRPVYSLANQRQEEYLGSE